MFAKNVTLLIFQDDLDALLNRKFFNLRLAVGATRTGLVNLEEKQGFKSCCLAVT